MRHTGHSEVNKVGAQKTDMDLPADKTYPAFTEKKCYICGKEGVIRVNIIIVARDKEGIPRRVIKTHFCQEHLGKADSKFQGV